MARGRLAKIGMLRRLIRVKSTLPRHPSPSLRRVSLRRVSPRRVSPRRSPRRAAPPAAPRRPSRYRGAFTHPARWHGASARSRPAQRAITPQQWSQRAITPQQWSQRAICRHGLHGQPPPLSFIALRTLICIEGAPGSRSSQLQAAPWHAGARFVALGALMCVMCHMPVLRCQQAANT